MAAMDGHSEDVEEAKSLTEAMRKQWAYMREKARHAQEPQLDLIEQMQSLQTEVAACHSTPESEALLWEMERCISAYKTRVDIAGYRHDEDDLNHLGQFDEEPEPAPAPECVPAQASPVEPDTGTDPEVAPTLPLSLATTVPPLQRYRIVRTLRYTLQGKLMLGVDRENGVHVALKVCSKKAIQNHQSLSGHRVLEDPLNEAAVLRELSIPGHLHIISLLETLEDNDNLWMVLEFAERGEFFDIISQAGRLDEEVARKYWRQLLGALQYIHSRDVCHLDISLENLLMSGEGDLKLCDFGLSRRFTDTTFQSSPHSKPGKVLYMAPEVFAGQEYDGPMADIYSAGVILFVLVFGCPPYEIPSQSDRRFRLMYTRRLGELLERWNVAHVASLLLVDLLSCILCPANERISMEQILDHAWMEEV